MIFPDVNVLVHIHREDAPHHAACLRWWEAVLNSPQPFGYSDTVLSGFLRIVTHSRVFQPPTPLSVALDFVEELRSAPNAIEVRSGPRHWEIFQQLCLQANAKGNLIPDAYLAALAIESGSEFITYDRDYARFPKLRWRAPE